MIPAPDDLFAMFENPQGRRFGEKVYAFWPNGSAAILDLKAGRLIYPEAIDGLSYLGLEFMLTECDTQEHQLNGERFDGKS